MTNGAGEAGPPLAQSRQVTIEALCEHFANDALPVEEFERRVEVAHRAGSVDELKALLRDLPGANVPIRADGAPLPAPRPHRRVAGAAHSKEKALVVAVMGGAVRKGRWEPARRNFSLSIMGGTDLDFRDALLPPGVTEVHVVAVMGGTEIIVPPGVNVESHGIGIMGAFEHVGGSDDYDPDAPTLRITGLALMGGVDIQVRLPGESAREARKRRKREREERRWIEDGRRRRGRGRDWEGDRHEDDDD